MVVRNRA